MFAEPRTFVDVTSAIPAFLKTAVPALGNRAFMGAPKAAATPYTTCYRLAGTDDRAMYQIDVWGQNRTQAETVAAQVATAIEGLSRFVAGPVLLHGAVVEDVKWLPDPASNKARVVVLALFTATASS
jgi:hypothetical protein